MVNKYARHLEQRDINPKTGNTWTIFDVPSTWKDRVEAKVIADGYYFEEDGTANRMLESVEEETPKKGKKK